MLTREQLLGSFQRRYRTVDTLIGTLRIQNLNEGEKSLWQDANYSKEGKLIDGWLGKSRRRLLAACLVDENGDLLLQQDDVARLREVDSGVVAQVAEACSEHIGLPLAEKQELEKNSDEAPAADSPTA